MYLYWYIWYIWTGWSALFLAMMCVYKEICVYQNTCILFPGVSHNRMTRSCLLNAYATLLLSDMTDCVCMRACVLTRIYREKCLRMMRSCLSNGCVTLLVWRTSRCSRARKSQAGMCRCTHTTICICLRSQAGMCWYTHTTVYIYVRSQAGMRMCWCKNPCLNLPGLHAKVSSFPTVICLRLVMWVASVHVSCAQFWQLWSNTNMFSAYINSWMIRQNMLLALLTEQDIAWTCC